MQSLILVSAAVSLGANAAIIPRAASSITKTAASTTITEIAQGATYTYASASDPGPATYTALAGQVLDVPYDANYNANAGKYKHVVLISIDGFHESDLEWYINDFPGSTLKALMDTGISYTHATTSAPSDSFPGSQAYMTGASSRTHGVYYDVSYDRQLYPPGSNCTGPQGTVVAYNETIDLNSTDISSGGDFDYTQLPLMKTAWGTCVGVLPNEFVRVNNIFEVVRNANMTTAYTDKHPAYTIANGPSGLGLSESFFPEIAPYATVSEVESYDDTHIAALVNWAKGNHYNGTAWSEGTPALFGGNFQAFSVAEKSAGYINGQPSPNVVQSLRYVDTGLSQIVQALKDTNVYQDTLIIVSAKHGQSPIDRSELLWIDPDAVLNATGVAVGGSSLDDGGYIWLVNNADAPRAAANLRALAADLGIEEVWVNDEVARHGFGNPKTDSRAPDIVLKTSPGVIYTTGSNKKTAEHGGLSPDDRDIALIVSNPCIKASVDSTYGISTRQIAATAVKALGLEPYLLQGVLAEGTQVLPGVPFA